MRSTPPTPTPPTGLVELEVAVEDTVVLELALVEVPVPEVVVKVALVLLDTSPNRWFLDMSNPNSTRKRNIAGTNRPK